MQNRSKLGDPIHQHALLVRWTHWLNLPLLLIMIWSGILIYWANRAYWPFLPNEVYKFLGLNNKLAQGLSYHFFFMWFYAVNGVCYLSYLGLTGKWRRAEYSGPQKIAYLIVPLLGVGSIVTGLAIYKPIQLGWLTSLFGSYKFARLIHYAITLSFVGFIFVHVIQVLRAGWVAFISMVSPKKIGLWILAIGLSVFGLGFFGIEHLEFENGLPSVLRQNLDRNEKIWSALSDRKNKKHPVSKESFEKTARVNGVVGLESSVNEGSWKINIATEVGEVESSLTSIALEQIKKLPQTTVLTDFKCIEGWSEVMEFSGLRFLDFIVHFQLGGHKGVMVSESTPLNDMFKFVGLETPDGQYFVSVDMASMLNANTLLAFTQNGVPLSQDHGAPIRLAIPNKYGVKSLKRIGKIVFSDEPLPDYWGSEGYDWDLGL